jgi:hypothetical protein
LNSEIQLYFQDPLNGITVSFPHSSSPFIVNFASNFKSIEDLDNFGETVPSRDIISATLTETSYFPHFLLALIEITSSLSSDRYNSRSSHPNQFTSIAVSLSSIFIFSITVVTLSFQVITKYHSKS